VIIHRREAAVAEASPLEAGFTIAGYRVEGLLGTGGMGAVYEATQLSLKRLVALKVIAPGVPVTDALRERFRREGELQGVIAHPHILPVHEAGEERGRLYIAMQLVRGQTLKALTATGTLDVAAALRILGDVADALDAAHAAGLVHRDVKPQNILIAPGDHAYLADFGLSRTGADETVTRSGQLLGSLPYMATEVACGERATAASDIYSFTCVVYECLVGLVPYPRDTEIAILRAHESEPPPQPSAIRPELPVALDDVIARGMAKQPGLRPFTARALMDDVRSAFGIESQGAAVVAPPTLPLGAAAADGESTRTRAPAAVVAKQTRRGRSGALAAMVAALLVVIGAGAGYLTGREPSRPVSASGRTVTVPAASPAYATRLNSAFAQLANARAPLERRLVKAHSAHVQASALATLATRYRHAGSAVRHARPPRAARAVNDSIARDLGRVGADYSALAAAARRKGREQYARARRAPARDLQRLNRALQGLERLHYRL
jgi:hypothetical protein